MSVFRITRAEFAKVFKKPTVYIMAVVLALVLVISLFSYKPAVREKTKVSIEGDNSAKIYAVFNGESQTDDTKTKIDTAYYDFTNNQILFYKLMYDKTNDLKSSLRNFEDSFAEMKSVYLQNNNSGDLVTLLEDTKKYMNSIMTNYSDMSAFNDYEKLNNIIASQKINEKLYYETKAFDAKESESNYTFENLKNNYVPNLNSMSSAKDFINHIETNNYMQIFANLVNYGDDIIYNILSDILIEISELQKSYINAVINGSLSIENKANIIVTIENLNKKINEFKSLTEGLISNDVVYAITTTKQYNQLLTSIDEFKNIYDSIDMQDSNEYTTKKEAAQKLKNSSYQNGLAEYVNNLYFLDINEEFNNVLAEYKKIATENQEKILEIITNNPSEDTSTVPILNNIAKYKQNGETYKDIVNCRIKAQLSNKLPLSVVKDTKNVDLKTFNSYENNTILSQLKYKLDKNIFDNEIGHNFSISKSIDSKTNMFDFTYYALKIATVLIIIFTIMMIASLITSETDSGTIKLLLMRPYRRGTVLMGKIMATFFFSLTFLTLSFVISLVAGYFMFGLPTVGKVLVTFNATSSFLISPIWLILLYFASCMLDILFYLLIALTVSVLFRSYIGAISTSLIIYIGAMVVSALLANSVVFAYLPFTNVSLFRFLGGEIVPGASGLSAILSTPVHSLQNIWLGLGITGVFSLALFIITFSTFRRRDF